MTQHIEEALIGYVMRYGGMCRDCADMDGVCASGMPCDTDQRRAVIRHTIAALTYGINNGFITSPFTATAALAAAEERGRIEERERLVKIVKRRMAVYQTKESASDCFQEPSNSNWDMYRYTRESHEWLLDAITKEPTP